MSEVWENGALDAAARYVQLKLADNADQDGRCFPSLSEICQKTLLSESSVRRAIQYLEKGGWLTVKRGLGAGNRSQYQLLKKVPDRNLSEDAVAITTSPEKVSTRKVSSAPEKGVRVTEKGVTQTEKGVSLTDPPNPPLGVTVINRQEPPEKPGPDEEENLIALIGEIACAHPKNSQRKMIWDEVTPTTASAIIEAAGVEARRAHCSEREALLMIRSRVVMLAAKVPAERWQYQPGDAVDFFRRFDYRLEPEAFMGRAATLIKPAAQPAFYDPVKRLKGTALDPDYLGGNHAKS